MRARVLFAASPEWRLIGTRLDGLLATPGFVPVKVTARTRAGFLTHEGHEAFVKRVDVGGYGRGLWARVAGSRARRALRGAQILAAGGFAHPAPLLVMETLQAGAIRTTYVLTTPLRTAQVLSRFALGRARPPQLRWRVSQRVGAVIRRLHDAGIYTRDLQETNLMIEQRQGEIVLELIDFEDFRRLRAVSLTRRLRNLVHLDRSIGRFASRAQRLRFLYDYLGRRPDRAEARRLIGQYLAVRARVERRRGRRAGATPPAGTAAAARVAAGPSATPPKK